MDRKRRSSTSHTLDKIEQLFAIAAAFLFIIGLLAAWSWAYVACVVCLAGMLTISFLTRVGWSAGLPQK